MKKEPRKARFPWDIGLLFGKPMRYALISGFNIFKTEKKSNACKLWIFFKFPCKTNDFYELDLECLMKPFRNEI